MLFFVLSFAFMNIGRQIGYALCRPLYRRGLTLIVAFGLLWGAGVAAAMHSLVGWQHPGFLLKWVMGYALGAYVAIPNYMLVDPATMAPDIMTKDTVLNGVPFITYIACSLAFAWLWR